MRVADNEAINNNQSLLIDEHKIQLDELQTTKPAVALKVRYSGSQALYPGTRISNSYTMGCPPVRGDNPRALASGLSYVQVDKHGIAILYHLHQCRPCTSSAISC